MRRILLSLLFVLSVSMAANAQVGVQRVGFMTIGAKSQGHAILAQIAAEGGLAKQFDDIAGNDKKIVNLQQQYYDYLSKFSDVLSLCACFYSIYYDVNEARKNLNEVALAIKTCPTGIFAAAFQKQRNNVMIETGKNIYDMCTSIVTLFDNKMTGKDRLDELQKLEVQLQKFSRQLRRLAEQIRYTSFIDLWDQYMGKLRRFTPRDRGDVALNCMVVSSLAVKEKIFEWTWGGNTKTGDKSGDIFGKRKKNGSGQDYDTGEIHFK